MKSSEIMFVTLSLFSITSCTTERVEGECEPQTCDELGIFCGATDDGCGNTLECGQCTGDNVCEEGICVDNTGRCNPKNCAEQDIECGPATDSCGTEIDCHECPAGKHCESGKCKGDPCTPKTCEEQNIECGPATDLCGNDITCDSCDEGKFCNQGLCSAVGEGTWTDSTTGLVWENPIRLPKGVQGKRAATWSAVNRYCKNLKSGGIENWRMPTIDELRTLVRKIAPIATGGDCLTSENCSNSDNCNDREAACNGCADENSDQLPDAADFLADGDCHLSAADIKGGQCYWAEGLSGPCSAYWSSTKDAKKRQQPHYYYLRFNKGLIWPLWGEMDQFAVRCVHKPGE